MEQATDTGAEFQGDEIDRLAAYLNAEQEDSEEGADGHPDEEEAADTDEESEEGDAEESAEGNDAASDTFTIKVEGKEVKVTREELIEMAQKSQSATQRWEEAAEMRRAAEAEQKATQDAFKRAEGLMHQYHSQLNATLNQFNNVDWQALLNEDPSEYLRVRHAFESVQNQMFALQQDQQRLQHEQAVMQQEETAKRLKAETAKVADAIPEWRDAKVAEKERSNIIDWMAKRGYTPQEIGNVTDARRLVELRDAWLMSQLRDKKALADKKVKDLPAPAAKPGGRSAPAQNKTAAAKAFDRARHTGKVEDAAAALAKLL
jgi:hypothetical protein